MIAEVVPINYAAWEGLEVSKKKGHNAMTYVK